jgi:hypothetical protein
LKLDIVQIANGFAHMRFLGVTNRTYRVRSSTELGAFSVQPFSTEASGSDPRPYHRAAEVRMIDVYIPVGLAPSGFFRPYAE